MVEYGLNGCIQPGSVCLSCLHLKYLPNFMSFSRSFSVNPGRLFVADGGVVRLVVVVVLGKCSYKIREN